MNQGNSLSISYKRPVITHMGDNQQNFSNFLLPVVNFKDASQQEDQTDHIILTCQAPFCYPKMSMGQ
jgi:hypothetical protein